MLFKLEIYIKHGVENKRKNIHKIPYRMFIHEPLAWQKKNYILFK